MIDLALDFALPCALNGLRPSLLRLHRLKINICNSRDLWSVLHGLSDPGVLPATLEHENGLHLERGGLMQLACWPSAKTTVDETVSSPLSA